MTQSKKLILILISILMLPSSLFAITADELDQNVKSHDLSFYQEFFDKVVYDQFTNVLRFDRVFDDLLFRKHDALDVNFYDEVPDSTFFVNRHGRNRLSISDLKKGPDVSSGPDPNGKWTVTKGKLDGVTAGFFIQDGKGDKFLLKFDPKDNPEMATSAEIIGHKFFHAFGYHVAEYYLVQFDPDILTVDPKATYYNEDGFKVQLTEEALDELISKIPKMKGGLIRASASKILLEHKGFMPFEGTRDNDPDDLIPHEDRRSIRALRVFGSWLNHYDLREGNTLDVVERTNGSAHIKHYLIDFASTLGSAANRPKVPAAGYENIVDWFEVGKAAPLFKVVEKDWEQKWDDLNRNVAYPELGYFDNSRFDPGSWKTQLPYEVFDRLTVSDAFWATKIIMSFTEEEIRALIETGEFSDPNNAKILGDILVARRDLIGRYWFAKVTPLDKIQLFEHGGGKYEIRFKDLMVEYGFAKAEEMKYRASVAGQDHPEFSSTSFELNNPPIGNTNEVVVRVQAKQGEKGNWSDPPLKVVLKKDAAGKLVVSEIDHS